ncbi:MAG: YdiU family protein [Burkholderiaceae bacterium]|jgi:uncharacterized protein YdiU (UPF0061 family)|nr:MAG: YdiU family protein [Burkholderiaceae bacterium]
MVAVVASSFPYSVRNVPFDELGDAFYTRVRPAPLPDPYWVIRNPALARELDIAPDWLASDDALQVFSGNTVLPESEPVATVYSGHQFGVWAGQLGDGRALLLGLLANGDELQLKGSGRTPYSRGADGRAVLRSTIREFLCSEAMHALGIPTTRALCITGSDQPVLRETVETAAIVARVAPSFIRFGHFEHFSYSGEHDELKKLADLVIAQHERACLGTDNPYVALLKTVVRRTARLLAQWQAVGFMHGVMNTDNMSILGLTMDYGPFQFMDAFDPAHICNHSDHYGRYAYQNQPAIAHWNLCALATALMPLIREPAPAQKILDGFGAAFSAAYARQMARKAGFAEVSPDISQWIARTLELMARDHTDYTIFWRRLTDYATGQKAEPVLALFSDRAAMAALLHEFDALCAHAAHDPGLMKKTNPAIVLRNHMAESAIARAKLKDFTLLEELLAALQRPYEAPAAHPEWTGLPPDWASQIQISCSS